MTGRHGVTNLSLSWCAAHTKPTASASSGLANGLSAPSKLQHQWAQKDGNTGLKYNESFRQPQRLFLRFLFSENFMPAGMFSATSLLPLPSAESSNQRANMKLWPISKRQRPRPLLRTEEGASAASPTLLLVLPHLQLQDHVLDNNASVERERKKEHGLDVSEAHQLWHPLNRLRLFKTCCLRFPS